MAFITTPLPTPTPTPTPTLIRTPPRCVADGTISVPRHRRLYDFAAATTTSTSVIAPVLESGNATVQPAALPPSSPAEAPEIDLQAVRDALLYRKYVREEELTASVETDDAVVEGSVPPSWAPYGVGVVSTEARRFSMLPDGEARYKQYVSGSVDDIFRAAEARIAAILGIPVEEIAQTQEEEEEVDTAAMEAAERAAKAAKAAAEKETAEAIAAARLAAEAKAAAEKALAEAKAAKERAAKEKQEAVEAEAKAAEMEREKQRLEAEAKAKEQEKEQNRLIQQALEMERLAKEEELKRIAELEEKKNEEEKDGRGLFEKVVDFIEDVVEDVVEDVEEVVDDIKDMLDGDEDEDEEKEKEGGEEEEEEEDDDEEDRSLGEAILDAIVDGVPTPAAENKPQIDIDYLNALIDNGKIKNLTVTKLKRMLTSCGLKTSGRKAELIARLTSFAKNH